MLHPFRQRSESRPGERWVRAKRDRTAGPEFRDRARYDLDRVRAALSRMQASGEQAFTTYSTVSTEERELFRIREGGQIRFDVATDGTVRGLSLYRAIDRHAERIGPLPRSAADGD